MHQTNTSITYLTHLGHSDPTLTIPNPLGPFRPCHTHINSIEYLSSENEIALVTSINKIVSYYRPHGLHVVTMFVEPELKSIEEKVVSTTLNTTGARDHVPEVER